MFEVCETKCDQCLFTDKRIVSSGAMKEILKVCAKKDTHFSCHKGTIVGKDICCRGFFDSGLSSNLLRISQRSGWVRFVPVPQADELVNTRPRKRRVKSSKPASP
jgi:hypothetical protein